MGQLELPRADARLAPRPDEAAVGIEVVDPGVAVAVGDVHRAVGGEGRLGGPVERPPGARDGGGPARNRILRLHPGVGGIVLAPDGGPEFAVGREQLDDVRVAVDDRDAAVRRDGDPVRPRRQRLLLGLVVALAAALPRPEVLLAGLQIAVAVLAVALEATLLPLGRRQAPRDALRIVLVLTPRPPRLEISRGIDDDHRRGIAAPEQVDAVARRATETSAHSKGWAARPSIRGPQPATGRHGKSPVDTRAGLGPRPSR